MTTKREDILAASLEQFSIRGFDGTTIPMIANRAGVGAGTIYRYFADKEALVNELFQHCMKQLTKVIQIDLQNKSTDEQFRFLFHQFFHFSKQNPHVVRFIQSQKGMPYLNQDSENAYQNLIDSIERIIIEGQKKEEVYEFPPNVLISFIVGGIIEVLKLFESESLEDSTELIERMGTFVARAVRID
ncbi:MULTISPECIES: TetR/AcrR family transcriptional regulator [Bacillaceae]|uniref:HTH tetR-type domain-containing protein n=1 Tax=Domibacillus aminovorans TaxID=29332 RepID=A0A177KRK6_9BACI|nr:MULTISPECIES: TetR/AcrR family transcriptional regulator [Bacillaceae]OAH55737.1 hypothetical protein AWH48_03410 [Domibacillus aminovorans]OAH60873.1 hypothetical protein AWH49_14940 [Domibacillus aminovorans]